MHDTQEVPPKLTSTTLPRRSYLGNCSPVSAAKRACGASPACLLQPAVARLSTSSTTIKENRVMRIAIVAGLAVAAIACPAPALAQLERFTNQEAGAGMKAALE